MIRRIFDGSLLTQVANEPELRPMLGGEGSIDMRPAAADPNNFCFQLGELGGFALMPIYPGCYEAHTIFLPGSGASVARYMREVRDWMFVNTGCEVVKTKTKDNLPAEHLARIGGFCPYVNSNGTTYWKLDLDTWLQVCSTLQEQGQAFHQMLETAKADAGSELKAHADDEFHDRAVGAAILMAQAGNGVKAVNVYNKFAILAGYAQAVLHSVTPFVVDIHDAIIGVQDGKAQVLQCR